MPKVTLWFKFPMKMKGNACKSCVRSAMIYEARHCAKARDEFGFCKEVKEPREEIYVA